MCEHGQYTWPDSFNDATMQHDHLVWGSCSHVALNWETHTSFNNLKGINNNTLHQLLNLRHLWLALVQREETHKRVCTPGMDCQQLYKEMIRLLLLSYSVFEPFIMHCKHSFLWIHTQFQRLNIRQTFCQITYILDNFEAAPPVTLATRRVANS